MWRPLAVAVFSLGLLAAPPPATADSWHHGGGWHNGGGWHRGGGWHGHGWGWRPHYGPRVVVRPYAYGGYYVPPPVYYAPPPVYYAPPAYYAPPGVSFGFTVR